MANITVIGAQWGDEGKGKVIDWLTPKVGAVVRFHGGNNAGHTLVQGGEKTVLHLVPSGILHPACQCLIAGGVVIDPAVLVAEIETLTKRGFLKDKNRLSISETAHLIMPYHVGIDRLREVKRGAGKIGTTGRGIGPAYEDKVGRTGIRMADLIRPEIFAQRLKEILPEKNLYLEKVLEGSGFSYKEILLKYSSYSALLKPFVKNPQVVLEEWRKQNLRILFEGAQGTGLDIDHGTYPYVTSSNTLAGGVALGLGIPPNETGEIIGITKAYTTRVGEGPFPTELFDKTGELLRKRGLEFGSTTGRPRRCGWLDVAWLRYAARLNGIQGWAVTKLDVLSGLETVGVAVGYKRDGRDVATIPATVEDWMGMEPVYKNLPGWKEDLSNVKHWEALPKSAKEYLKTIERETGIPVELVSVGAGREQTIVKNDSLWV